MMFESHNSKQNVFGISLILVVSLQYKHIPNIVISIKLTLMWLTGSLGTQRPFKKNCAEKCKKFFGYITVKVTFLLLESLEA